MIKSKNNLLGVIIRSVLFGAYVIIAFWPWLGSQESDSVYFGVYKLLAAFMLAPFFISFIISAFILDSSPFRYVLRETFHLVIEGVISKPGLQAKDSDSAALRRLKALKTNPQNIN